MGFVKVLSQVLIISVIYSISTSASKLQELVRGDVEECTMELIKIFQAKDFGNFTDFQGKKYDEIKIALINETRKILRNGNNYTKHFEEGLTNKIQEYGGLRAFLDEIREDKLPRSASDSYIRDASCVFSAEFQSNFKVIEESMRSGRLEHSNKYLQMIKDLVINIDEGKTFQTSRYFSVLMGQTRIPSYPDFFLSASTLVLYIPKERAENTEREMLEIVGSDLERLEPFQKELLELFGMLKKLSPIKYVLGVIKRYDSLNPRLEPVYLGPSDLSVKHAE